MVTGASTADLAVILIDARKGVLTQTRRHSFLAHLIGIRHLVVAVNKMDLVDYDQRKFDAIFADDIGITDFGAMPISALSGDNISTRSRRMPWYAGPSLIEYLETVPVDIEAAQRQPFRMPGQWVNRSNPDFRGYAGLISAGTIQLGNKVRLLPSGLTSRVTRILGAEEDS